MKKYFIPYEITESAAKTFVKKFHYSPIMPKHTSHFLGFYEEQELIAVITLGHGTRPRHTINAMFPSLEVLNKNEIGEWKVRELRDVYFEIGKMCIDDRMPTNTASRMLKTTRYWISKNYPKTLFLYTMADGLMGKVGGVYKASGFYFGEKFKAESYMMENNEKLHPRSTADLCKKNAAIRGKDKMARIDTNFMVENKIRHIEGYNFRYIFPLNKKAEKIMKEDQTIDWTKDKDRFPNKERDLKWFDTTEDRFEIDMPEFSFDKMKFNPQTKSQSDTFDLSSYFN